jgi:hypothetical protein
VSVIFALIFLMLFWLTEWNGSLDFNKESNKKAVVETSMVSIFGLPFRFSNRSLFRTSLADWSGIDSQYITYTIWILALDALVIIPFSKLRSKPMVYAAIKLVTSWLTILSVVFLLYPNVEANPMVFCVLFMWITSNWLYILG